MASEKSSGLCQQCHGYADLSIFSFTTTKQSATRELGQKWGWCGSREFYSIRNNVDCSLCRLTCKALAQDTRSLQPLANHRIHYYRLLFGEYESRSSNNLLPDARFPPYSRSPRWKLNFINTLHVSTDSTVLDPVDYSLARVRESQERISPRPHEVAEGTIMVLEGAYRTEAPFSRKSFLHGREVKTQVNFALVDRWLRLCDSDHKRSCLPEPLYKGSHPHLRLIDIEARMIVTAPFPRSCATLFPKSYATLSYVWGEPSAQNLTLNKDTHKRLTTPGGLGEEMDDIPLTIKDAMAVCSGLSIPYLWIDAVCIQQDDEDDKEHQVKAMDLIYSSAYVTIVAAFGFDSSAGLPGVREGSRASQQVEQCNGLTLAAARPDFRSTMRDAHWQTRAWTFQETVLSRRLLIFTEFQVFFQCNSALWWEDTHRELSQRMALEIKDDRTPEFRKPFWKSVLPSSPDFRAYVGLVQDYTKRDMTWCGDGHRAFMGLESALRKPFDSEFFYGLPHKYFDAALGFEVPLFEEDSLRHCFPSWSWCEWTTESGVDYMVGKWETVRWESLNSFYRIQQGSGSRMQPILVKSSATQPCTPHDSMSPLAPVSFVILDKMSKDELQKVIIFKASSATLYVDDEAHTEDFYSVRPTHPDCMLEGSANTKMGNIHLPFSWRKGHGTSFEFIALTMQYRDEVSPPKMQLMMIETDHRGLSYRIQLCSVEKKHWLLLRLLQRVVYLL